MNENLIYLPVSEETFYLIHAAKKESEDINLFLKNLLKEKTFEKDINAAQREKMKELWDNEYDEIRNDL